MSVNINPVNRIGEISAPFQVHFLQRPTPVPIRDEVLIRVRASAICGSDLHIARGLHPSAPLPVTIGHEFSGDVVLVGPDVKKTFPGDRVTVEPCIVCGVCDACRRGEYSYCRHISFTYRNGDGAMADYVLIHESGIHPLPDHLSYETGALIEPLAVATHGVRRADVRLGDRILIIGTGAIGLLTAAMCRRGGASRVIVAGRSDWRLQLALEFGATDIINSTQTDLISEILHITDGNGIDKSFECVGKEECFLQALLSLKKNGTAVIAGIYESTDIHIPINRLITHELRVLGTQGYCWDFPTAIAAAGELPMQKLITHTFPLEQLQDALDTALSPDKRSVKVLICNPPAC